MAKEFVLSDESKNSYGFKVVTSGINLERFRQNTVMYYNHDRDAGVIGQWENVRIDGKRLLGTSVFDLNDPLGAKVAKQVEDGFLKGASIGINNAEIEEINSETVIVSCDLYECSICDIPSNGNALTLYVRNKPVKNRIELIRLSKDTNSTSDLQPVIKILGLPNDATVKDIIAAIKALKGTDTPTKDIDEAIKMQLIAPDEKSIYLQLAKSNPTTFYSLISQRKSKELKNREEKGLQLTCQAIRDGRINADAYGKVKAYWLNCFKIDFEAASIMLDSIPKRISVTSLINSNNDTSGRENWTLADYRKKVPKELKNNPELYQRLLEQEKAKVN